MKWLNLIPQRLDRGATPTFAGLLAGDGTAAAPSISFAAQSNTGFYRRASGQTAYSSAGVISLFFDASGGIWDANGQARWKFNGAGGLEAIAGGVGQNITLTPSTVGFVSVESGANPYNGKVQFGSASYACYISNEASSSGAFAINGFATIIFRTGGVDAGMINASRRFLLGTTTDSGALLQVGTNTITAAGGMVFGTDCFLYRSAATVLRLETAGNYAFEVKNSTGIGSACMSFVNTTGALFIGSDNSSGSAMGSGIAYAGVITTTTSVPLVFRTSGVTAVTIDTSQRTILSGALRLANAYVAGAVVGTGYVTIQDSTGTTYRVPVLV